MRLARLVPVAVVLLAAFSIWREYERGGPNVYGLGPALTRLLAAVSPAPPAPPAESATRFVWSPQRVQSAVGVYEADFLDDVILGYEYTFTFTVERAGEGVRLVAESQGATPFEYVGKPSEEPIRFVGSVAGAALAFNVEFSWPQGETLLGGTYFLTRKREEPARSRTWQARRVR